MIPRLALLRGINVGGSRKLPMADLRAVCGDLGWSDVRTYIQTGNVVFRAPGPEAELAEALQAAVAQRFGYDVTVILRDPAQLQAAIDAIPFPTEGVDPRFLHVLFLDREPEADAVAALDPDRSPGDRFEVIGRHVYLQLPNGAGRSKLGLDWFEGQLSVRGSARNLRTVRVLREWLCDSDPSS